MRKQEMCSNSLITNVFFQNFILLPYRTRLPEMLAVKNYFWIKRLLWSEKVKAVRMKSRKCGPYTCGNYFFKCLLSLTYLPRQSRKSVIFCNFDPQNPINILKVECPSKEIHIIFLGVQNIVKLILIPGNLVTCSVEWAMCVLLPCQRTCQWYENQNIFGCLQGDWTSFFAWIELLSNDIKIKL